MDGGQISTPVRGQCCMLCYRPLYGTGISIYHTKCYQTDKSLYARLMEVTNYTSSIPQLASDMMCSICYTMISQSDQLGSQLGQVTRHIRALFHQMVQRQTEVARLSLSRPAPDGRQSEAAVSEARTAVNGTVPPAVLSPPATSRPEPSPEQRAPTNLQTFKKPTEEEAVRQPAEAAQRQSWPTSSPESGDGGGLQPAGASSSGQNEENSLFSLSAFLQSNLRDTAGGGERASRPLAPAPTVTQTGDFTDKFVRGTASSDAYRYQCVLCQKLGDCEEAVRRHVRADHPGADRISFPESAAQKRPRAPSSGGPKPPKMLRSITATAPAMAQNIADRAYVCVNCDKAFGCEAFLARHVEAQKCGQLFGCQYCGKEFTRSDKKVRHERSHTGERPYSCEYCGKAFSRRDKCTKHERTHTRCQPLECHSCGEMLSTTSEYTSHRRLCGERTAAAAAAARAAAAAAASAGTLSLSTSAWPQPLPQAPPPPLPSQVSDV
ncbi:zinc finger protein 135-like isoform X2 [Amphibalanus amphitrite]|nr:zinc finger protein 135-like isoform X2 [Amphibalanus amphitrite]XP_043224386.1 zinc finger protein 135-like isoform X2 [Amphibalanus amphitrite]XP_043224387.1 zinc finger protein 135-like isoform X2 [Amphibalanus amphitrite]